MLSLEEGLPFLGGVGKIPSSEEMKFGQKDEDPEIAVAPERMQRLALQTEAPRRFRLCQTVPYWTVTSRPELSLHGCSFLVWWLQMTALPLTGA
jgi:hypothetical protein